MTNNQLLLRVRLLLRNETATMSSSTGAKRKSRVVNPMRLKEEMALKKGLKTLIGDDFTPSEITYIAKRMIQQERDKEREEFYDKLLDDFDKLLDDIENA